MGKGSRNRSKRESPPPSKEWEARTGESGSQHRTSVQIEREILGFGSGGPKPDADETHGRATTSPIKLVPPSSTSSIGQTETRLPEEASEVDGPISNATLGAHGAHIEVLREEVKENKEKLDSLKESLHATEQELIERIGKRVSYRDVGIVVTIIGVAIAVLKFFFGDSLADWLKLLSMS